MQRKHMMQRKQIGQPNWRELALYGTLAACLAVANASIAALFIF